MPLESVRLTLASLDDCLVAGQVDGQVLVWNAAASKWVPGDAAGAIVSAVAGNPATGPSATPDASQRGKIVYVAGTGGIQDTYWRCRLASDGATYEWEQF